MTDRGRPRKPEDEKVLKRSISFPPDLYVDILQIAEEERRPVSNMVVVLLEGVVRDWKEKKARPAV